MTRHVGTLRLGHLRLLLWLLRLLLLLWRVLRLLWLGLRILRRLAVVGGILLIRVVHVCTVRVAVGLLGMLRSAVVLYTIRRVLRLRGRVTVVLRILLVLLVLGRRAQHLEGSDRWF